MYSCKEQETRIPQNVEPHLVQRFADVEWAASNFAKPAELQWFRDAKYGMFIHFGLSTHDKGDLSWGSCYTRKAPDVGNGPVPDEVWRNWPKEFSLEKFNASEWVSTAKAAGFKYLVVIAKHHEGFHMWDTAYSEFKVTHTPFRRDYLKELADACHASGMRFGLYYSQRDWYHPDYMPVDAAKVVQNGVHWVLKSGETCPMGERHRKYIEYQFNACRELCTRYGKVDNLWWDAAWWGGMFTAAMWDGERLTRLVRTLQPGILMNNRCSVPGDFDTPEQRLGFFQDWRSWESCVCLEHGWSYTGAPPKAKDDLIRMLVNNVCCDGNLLLSWGPKWNGEFDSIQRDRLLEVGEWLRQNGQAVYGTRGGPWKFNKQLGSVRNGRTVYLHVLEWRGRELRLPAVSGSTLISARLLHGKTLPSKQWDNQIVIEVAEADRVVPDTIIELAMDQVMDDKLSVAVSACDE